MSGTATAVLRWGSAYLQDCGIDSARLDAEVLLMHCLRWERPALYCARDYQLTPDEEVRFHALVKRRGSDEPIAYLVGEREFWSLPLAVRPGVLIPRPDTEWVVEAALRYAPEFLGLRSHCNVLDVGTGSGNIAIAVAASQALVEVTAIDCSLEALAVAQCNAQTCRVGERIHLVCSDLLSALHPSTVRFDLLLSNPPYIAAEEWAALPATVRCYEPRQALDGGSDGLLFYRRLFAEAWPYLVADGIVVVEVGHRQASEVSRLLTQSQQWELIELIKDYSGIERVVVARRRQGGSTRHGLHRSRRRGPASRTGTRERGEKCCPAVDGESVADNWHIMPTQRATRARRGDVQSGLASPRSQDQLCRDRAEHRYDFNRSL
jgi:release factor glutamine methyltransferase